MMYQGWKAQSENRAERVEPKSFRPVTLHVRSGRQEAPSKPAKGGWLDSMLGAGSSKTVRGALSSQAPRTVSRQPATLRMQALRSNDDEAVTNPKRGKGVIRLLALAAVFSLVVLHTKPWQHLPSMDFAARFLKTKPASMALTAQPTPEPQAEVKPLGPVVDAKGKAVALWRGESGQWFLVNAVGQLRKAGDLEASSRIDLPLLAGVRSKAVETSSAASAPRLMVLDVQPALLQNLLPLSPQIAAEVQWIMLDKSGEVILHTQSGANVRLGADDFAEKEAKLSAVLADLAARKKYAASVDLRFKDSAVVRLASR